MPSDWHGTDSDIRRVDLRLAAIRSRNGCKTSVGKAKRMLSTMTVTTWQDAIMTICLQLWRSLTSRRTVLVNGR